MLIIGGAASQRVSMSHTKEGYTVSFQPVMSNNSGTAADGSLVGTMIGKRPVITITTNRLKDKSFIYALFNILYRYSEYEVTYPLPYGSGYGKQKFKLSSDLSVQYQHMKHGVIAPTTITLTAIEARVIEKPQ